MVHDVEFVVDNLMSMKVVVVVAMKVEKEEYHWFLLLSAVLDLDLMIEMDEHRLNELK
jgi:hypothetical protein